MSEIFKLTGLFFSYSNWICQLKNKCEEFYKKFNVYPDVFCASDNTVEKMFNESEENFKDWTNMNHAMLNEDGTLICPSREKTDGSGIVEFAQDLNNEDLEDYQVQKEGDSNKNSTIENSSAINKQNITDDELLEEGGTTFGVQEDNSIRFATKKYSLIFVGTTDIMPDNVFEISFGEHFDDDGEEYDFEDDKDSDCKIAKTA